MLAEPGKNNHPVIEIFREKKSGTECKMSL